MSHYDHPTAYTHRAWKIGHMGDAETYWIGEDWDKPFLAKIDRDAPMETVRMIAEAPVMLEVLRAFDDAQRLTDEAVETLERAIAEGWYNDPSGSCHIGDADRRADEAWARCHEQRRAILARIEGAS